MNIVIVENDKFSVVDKKRSESLADYVRRVREEKRLSLTDVQRGSKNKIAASYVSRIENGYALNPSTEKIKALAAGLDISEDEVFAVARGYEKADMDAFRESLYYRLFELSKKAPEAKREMLDEMLRALMGTFENEHIA